VQLEVGGQEAEAQGEPRSAPAAPMPAPAWSCAARCRLRGVPLGRPLKTLLGRLCQGPHPHPPTTAPLSPCRPHRGWRQPPTPPTSTSPSPEWRGEVGCLRCLGGTPPVYRGPGVVACKVRPEAVSERLGGR